MSGDMSSLDLATYLDRFLRIAEIPDYPGALNGLQVENSGRLGRILCAVDACQATIDAAVKEQAGFVIVHHGLFWSGLRRLTGRHGRRFRTLIGNDIALYAAHIPLDCHPDVGNNAVLAQELGLEESGPFGRYEDIEIGVMGTLELDLPELASRVEGLLDVRPQVVAKGPQRTRRVAIVSGAAASALEEAHDRGADTFITGEAPHHAFFDAEEWGINLILAGHYASETVGVQALGEHLRDRFAIPFEFFHHPTGL